MDKRLIQFTEKETQSTLTLEKRHSTSLGIMVMYIKFHRDIISYPGLATFSIVRLWDNRIWVKNDVTHTERNLVISSKITHAITLWPNNFTSRTYSNSTLIKTQSNVCARLCSFFSVILLKIAKSKEHKYGTATYPSYGALGSYGWWRSLCTITDWFPDALSEKRFRGRMVYTAAIFQ